MKILAVFLLSVFFFFPTGGAAPLQAQDLNDPLSHVKDCGFLPALKIYTVERRVQVGLGPDLEIVSPQIVEDLEDGQNCLNEDLIRLKSVAKELQSPLITNDHLLADILDLQDKLKQTESDLQTAQRNIKDLGDRLKTAEGTIFELKLQSLLHDHELQSMLGRTHQLATSPKAGANAPKAAVSKAKAPASKPKPTVDSSKNP